MVTPRKLYRLGVAMALAGGMGIAGFAAPALAAKGGTQGANFNSAPHGVTNGPAGKEFGSEGNPHGVPPGIQGNTHAKGVCSDFATANSKDQGRGKSKDGNPNKKCNPTTTPTTAAPTTPTTAGTSVLGESITKAPTQAPTAVLGQSVTKAPAAATTAAPVAALPFTGPAHAGTLAGIGLSTMLLGGGLVLATRRRPLAVVRS